MLGRARGRIDQPVAHGSEVASQIPCGTIAGFRILGQAALQYPDEGCGGLRHSGPQTLQFVTKNCGQGFRWLDFRNAGKPVTISNMTGAKRELVGSKIEFDDRSLAPATCSRWCPSPRPLP